MAGISYYLKKIKNMSFNGMFERINIVSKKCKKPKIVIFFDMIWCGFRYGAGYMDYDVIGFYKLNHKQRDSMLTRGRNDKIVKALNKREYWNLFNNKNEFNTMFSRFVTRDWIYINPEVVSRSVDIYLNEEFIKFKHFIGRHPSFFAKPNNGQCGKGIERIEVIALDSFLASKGIEYDIGYKIPPEADVKLVAEIFKDDGDKVYSAKIRALYKYLYDSKLYLLEEPIKQHKKMNSLNPSSVNTGRIVSIMNDKDEVTLMASFIRIGNGKAVVDNFNSGGMTAMIDIEKGIIVEDAVNKEGKLFDKHPLSGTTINGFQIPYFEEAKKMVVEAAKLSKNVRYVGWDVAITVDGPTLVEGNQYPGHDIYQVAEKLDENSLGVWPKFKKAIS